MGLVGWAALFGLLGFNFIRLSLNNPGESDAHVGGWILSGIVFWVMALRGLTPAVALAIGWARRRGEPEPSLFREPLVRAAVHPAPEQPVSLQHPEQPSVPTRLVIPRTQVGRPAAMTVRLTWLCSCLARCVYSINKGSPARLEFPRRVEFCSQDEEKSTRRPASSSSYDEKAGRHATLPMGPPLLMP